MIHVSLVFGSTVVSGLLLCFFFFKQKTAYEMRISDWSSDVCSSDLMAALCSVIFSTPIVKFRKLRAISPPKIPVLSCPNCPAPNIAVTQFWDMKSNARDQTDRKSVV